MRRLAILAALATAAACAHAGTPGMASLEDAAGDVAHGSKDPSALALAGWDAYLLQGDGASLAARCEEALRTRRDEPWALMGRAEALHRSLREAEEGRALLDVIERAPASPVATVAAGRLIRLTRRSLGLDEEILRRGKAALDRGLPGETSGRLRAAVRAIRVSSGADAAGSAAEAGLLSTVSVVGPFSPWHELDIGRSFPPEHGPVAARYQGPPGVGSIELRPMRFPSGALSLAPESRSGDVFYLLAVADVPTSGRYALRLGASPTTQAAVFVDGARVLERGGPGIADAASRGVVLDVEKGSHLLAVRVDRQAGRGDLMVALVPEDGAASAVRYRAARPGEAPGRAPSVVSADGIPPAPPPSVVAEALGQGTLGAYLAASDAAERDPEGAKKLVTAAVAALPGSPPLLVLRAELAAADSTVPDRIGAGRAMNDLETALAKDGKSARALIDIARLLQSAGRNDDALARIDAAEAASPGSSMVQVERAHVLLARGASAMARESVREALHREPDSCEAGSLLSDLARREDAIADADDAAIRFAHCSDGRTRLAGHLADRGRDDAALALARELYAEAPSDPGAASRLADRLLAQGKAGEAAAVFGTLETLWPRTASLALRRSELLARAGDLAGADRERERAMILDGGDVGLRRAMAYRKGTDVLSDQHRDAMKLIHDFEASGRTFDTKAVLLLDFAAVEAFPDGSTSERTQTIAKVLDKGGIDTFGEFDVPPGAQILSLRTIKKDGRVLYPEEIASKDTISMPGLEVGDYVEREYVVAHAPTGPSMPGWTSSPFFFRETDVPLLDSVFVIRAAPGAELELDPHNGVTVPPVVEKDGTRTVTIEYRDNPAVLAEPLAPSHFETMPWVQAGSGADEMQVGWLFGDGLADDVGRSADVQTWAHQVARKSDGSNEGIARALYEDLMERIPGAEGGFGTPASHILAAGRGNRAVLLKAGLDEMGVPCHFAAVRTFDEDPTRFRFPSEARWGYVLLVAEPEPGKRIWLDPRTRWAPFGTIADSAQGVPAIVLPGPGEEPQRVETSVDAGEKGRSDGLTAQLTPDGTLSGKGWEKFAGYDAAMARGALEQMDPDRRRQAVEQALARSFRNVEVEDLDVDLGKGVGADVTVNYTFKAPGFARDRGNGQLSVDLDFFAARLGRRYLNRGSRTTPLLLRDPERATSRVEIALPAGVSASLPAAVKQNGKFGSYERSFQASAGKLVMEERLDMSRGRVPPDHYAEFAAFVQAVDQAQSGAVDLKPKG